MVATPFIRMIILFMSNTFQSVSDVAAIALLLLD